eukprot:262564-Rhodomonas_salina.5
MAIRGAVAHAREGWDRRVEQAADAGCPVLQLRYLLRRWVQRLLLQHPNGYGLAMECLVPGTRFLRACWYCGPGTEAGSAATRSETASNAIAWSELLWCYTRSTRFPGLRYNTVLFQARVSSLQVPSAAGEVQKRRRNGPQRPPLVSTHPPPAVCYRDCRVLYLLLVPVGTE